MSGALCTRGTTARTTSCSIIINYQIHKRKQRTFIEQSIHVQIITNQRRTLLRLLRLFSVATAMWCTMPFPGLQQSNTTIVTTLKAFCTALVTAVAPLITAASMGKDQVFKDNCRHGGNGLQRQHWETSSGVHTSQRPAGYRSPLQPEMKT